MKYKKSEINLLYWYYLACNNTTTRGRVFAVRT